MLELIAGIASGIVLAALGWLWLGGRNALDRRRIFDWMQGHTKDEPGDSHVTTPAIAKGAQLPEDRVRRACLSHPRVYHCTSGTSETWSIWRREPQSVYATRGLLILGQSDNPVTAADWRDVESRFDRIDGEVNGARQTYRETGKVKWALNPVPKTRRLFKNGALWTSDDGVRGLQLFQSEARIAGRLWLRQHSQVSNREPLEAWLEAVACVVDRGTDIEGAGRDHEGEHDTQFWERLVNASKVACARFASEL